MFYGDLVYQLVQIVMLPPDIFHHQIQVAALPSNAMMQAAYAVDPTLPLLGPDSPNDLDVEPY